MQLIDRKKLVSLTLNYEQYMNIKKQLDIDSDGEKVNIRDKLILELAWSGLTNMEIRSVKEEDIEFFVSEYGRKFAIISLENKIIIIDDSEITKDIKLCLKETYSIKVASDGRRQKSFYRNSEYLIKPINVGSTSSRAYLENPHFPFKEF